MIGLRPFENMDYRLAKRLCAWGVLCVALLTYLFTLEPTASFWDCPEYVSVATALEPGHPPGNPFWMLVARFFINFAPAPEYRALAVNVMSAVCSALTVMLLFLTIEFFARRLIKPAGRASSILTLGASCVGVLAFCWSDSFWFSAVEAEVYSFSTLCTALLFWLALVYYEKRREQHSDRYIILLAYLIGLTLGVHELNLLCLPALLLVVAYGQRDRLTVGQILLVLLAGLCAIAAVLYGIIPGFIALAQRVELYCVNGLGLGFNSGLLLTCGIVSLLLVGTGIWLNACIWQRCKRLLRFLRITVWSVFMLLLGFSCYAVIMIRAAACPPMDTGHPADIFSFASYFQRDQYGKSPLVYGAPFTATPMRQLRVTNGDSTYTYYALKQGKRQLVRGVPGMPDRVSGVFGTKADSLENARLRERGSDCYLTVSYQFEKQYPPELCMWFPRMHSHSEADKTGYRNWIGADEDDMYAPRHYTVAVDSMGNPVKPSEKKLPAARQVRPTYMQNFKYFAVYQCAYMYWRYFLWNFVGRQNDYTGHGEPDAGNFITGIDPLDCLMLDVAADAPAGVGRGNAGRNVYFALPLILGILGLACQLRAGRRGRRQAMVVTTLFVLTGIAIVVYLNQGPVQARDRDYSFLGSWYAFSIWIGLGTLSLHALLSGLMRGKPGLCASLSVAVAAIVPLQMLSQTLDDHDRSGRTAARDVAHNMLCAVKPQAIVFASQDNNIFPLSYMIEVEEKRPDVRVISSPYMGLLWYPSQWMMPMRDSRPVELTATPGLLASSILNFVQLGTDTTWTPATEALHALYTEGVGKHIAGKSLYPELKTPRVYFMCDGDTVRLDMRHGKNGKSVHLLGRGDLLTLDILATNAASSSPRPIYWTIPLGSETLGGNLTPYLERTGIILHLNTKSQGLNFRATAHHALHDFRYGTEPGLVEKGEYPYFDPVSAQNIGYLRSVIIESARELSLTGDRRDALTALALIERTESALPDKMVPFTAISVKPDIYGTKTVPRFADEGLMTAEVYENIAAVLARPDLQAKAQKIRKERMQALGEIDRYRKALRTSYRRFITFRLENLLHVLHPLPAPDTTSQSSSL